MNTLKHKVWVPVFDTPAKWLSTIIYQPEAKLRICFAAIKWMKWMIERMNGMNELNAASNNKPFMV